MAALTEQVVAVTGAGTGIGEATARRLARAGAAVVLGARRIDRLEAVAQDIRDGGGRAEAVPVDVTSADDLRALVGTAVDRLGRLDVLVSNAGIGPISRMDARRTQDWDAMIDVNLRGVLHGIDAALPVFTAQGRGHLVTVLSTAGIAIVPTMGVYAGTKNAVRTILEAVRQESTDGVLKTSSISPGFVRTDFSESITDDTIRGDIAARAATFGLDPDDVARAVEFVVDQPWEVEIGDLTIRPTTQG
ncbi:SDR family oxidoreductase [Williamsia sp. SKLECPSW1]